MRKVYNAGRGSNCRDDEIYLILGACEISNCISLRISLYLKHVMANDE